MVLKIGGFEELSLTDYPGKVSSVVFLLNCNFRCKYCYNVDLLSEANFAKSSRKLYNMTKVLDYLTDHKKMLEGVVISGGEPCLDSSLIDFIMRIKAIGLLVKLDTNGSNPDLLKTLLDNNMIDYVAMDIKAPFDKYKAICGYGGVNKIKRSIGLLKKSIVPHEFRTVVWPRFNKKDFKSISKLIVGEKWFLQPLQQSKGMFEEALTIKNFSKRDINDIVKSLGSGCKVVVR